MTKILLVLLLGLVIGGGVGWYKRGLNEQDVRAATQFRFTDNLVDRQAPYLSAEGSWRGGDLADKINTVQIDCYPSESNCDLYEAGVLVVGPQAKFLTLNKEAFRITKVDAQSVVAERSRLCIRVTLTLDRIAKAVTIVRTKTNQEDACSMVQNEPLALFLGEPLSTVRAATQR